MIDDTAGVEDGGIFDTDVSANICTGGNYDVFTDLGVIGDTGGRVNGANEADTSLFQSFSIGLADPIVADGDDAAADAELGKFWYQRQVTQDLNIIDLAVMQSGAGIQEADDLKLMIAPEDVEHDAAVPASTDDNDFHVVGPIITVLHILISALTPDNSPMSISSKNRIFLQSD